ncbi:hypothetical protein [Clostridium akagii]|uniref:hypothetical protein n=1 Tax=Clostridium akagii TaxID=91623 RepID=UPI000ACB6DF2|nr:hypothetical protein [Clostridium akagii]
MDSIAYSILRPKIFNQSFMLVANGTSELNKVIINKDIKLGLGFGALIIFSNELYK